jgi:hypothetical protein
MKGLRKLKHFYNRYERYLIPGALIFGFLTDALTFHLINFTAAMLLLLFHLLFSGVNISVINFYEEKKISGKFFSYWRVLAPLFLQYSFGNLFSAFLIFYSHSGSFFASWPFIIVIIFLMIGNEIFRKYNTRPVIQISVYFFALFSYLNIVFPSLLKNLSVFIFLGSGVISLLVVFFFVTFLSFYILQIKEKRKMIFVSVFGIFLAMNTFYFLNLIPPIPLSIKTSGVYHDIKRVGNGYLVTREDCGNMIRCFLYHERRYIRGEREVLYLFSAVHAPSEMNLNVVHEWQRLSDEKKKWETVANIPFSVVGGREVGYRWYTYYSVYPGYWRVNIKTEDGKTIGRKNFYVFYKENIKRNEEAI